LWCREDREREEAAVVAAARGVGGNSRCMEVGESVRVGTFWGEGEGSKPPGNVGEGGRGRAGGEGGEEFAS
jgi:hypothetical protein